VLSPPKRPFRAAGNWEEVETALGLSLPADYKAFIATYGGGTIGSLVEIPSPFSFGVDIRQRWESWASFFDDLAEYEEVPYPVFPQSGGLLPFGTLGTVDILGWRTVGEPDRWPFVYYDRDEGFFEVQGLSAVEFVLEAVTQRSPLLIRLRSESGFDPPCDFEPFMAEPRSIEFVHHREIDLDVLTERLASRWPAEQVQIRRGPVGARLLIEPLAGQISLSSDTGDERTLAGIYYDQSCSPRVEESIQDLLNAGFTEIRRG
jgi:hypothetical protein